MNFSTCLQNQLVSSYKLVACQCIIQWNVMPNTIVLQVLGISQTSLKISYTAWTDRVFPWCGTINKHLAVYCKKCRLFCQTMRIVNPFLNMYALLEIKLNTILFLVQKIYYFLRNLLQTYTQLFNYIQLPKSILHFNFNYKYSYELCIRNLLFLKFAISFLQIKSTHFATNNPLIPS